MCSGYGMRRIYVFTLLASAISGSAFAQSPQLEYSNPTTGQPYAVQVTPAQQNYVLPPPHYIVPPYYVVPPPHYVAPPPHYVVRQGSDPAATPNASRRQRRGIRAAAVFSKGSSAARRLRRMSFLRTSRVMRRCPKSFF